MPDVHPLGLPVIVLVHPDRGQGCVLEIRGYGMRMEKDLRPTGCGCLAARLQVLLFEARGEIEVELVVGRGEPRSGGAGEQKIGIHTGRG